MADALLKMFGPVVKNTKQIEGASAMLA